MMTSSFADRIVRAAKLEPALYEEVEHDDEALNQALALIILSSVAAGVGVLLPGMGLAGLFWGIVAALIGWVFWAITIYFVGVKWLGMSQTSSSIPEILRVLGFASAPGLIRIFGVFAPMQPFVFLIASVWMLAAMVIGLRQALDYTNTGRAIAVCIIGWLVQILMTSLLLGMNRLL